LIAVGVPASGKIGDGHGADGQHAFVNGLLLHALELRLEVVVVDGVADGSAGNGGSNLFAESVLFAEFFPVVKKEKLEKKV
jgi:hypothetical protein